MTTRTTSTTTTTAGDAGAAGRSSAGTGTRHGVAGRLLGAALAPFTVDLSGMRWPSDTDETWM